MSVLILSQWYTNVKISQSFSTVLSNACEYDNYFKTHALHSEFSKRP